MKAFLEMDGAPEFAVKRRAARELIPCEDQIQPDVVDEAELRRLRQTFRGTTPQGREIVRKIVLTAEEMASFVSVSVSSQRMLIKASGQIELQFDQERYTQNPARQTNPI
jgi:hypothetical protein